MDDATDRPPRLPLLTALLAALWVLLLFYGLDHAVMALQGLPLGWNLTPAQ